MEYIIGGTGNASANVIETGLNDTQGTCFHVIWTGKPTAGQARVLDWLITRNEKFIVYSTGKVHPSVLDASLIVYHMENLVEDAFAQAQTISENTLKVLVLFDTDESGEPTELTKELVFGASDRNLECLELTNGLAPLAVDPGHTPSEATRKPQDEPKPEVVSTPRMEKVLTVVKPVMQITVYSDGSIQTKQL
jgi:hypothetical protein